MLRRRPRGRPLEISLHGSTGKQAGCTLQVSDADYLAAVLPISLVKAAVIGVASAPSI